MMTKMMTKSIDTFISEQKRDKNVRERQVGKRSDIWIDFTTNVKENKTLCKPCGATISGKNTT